MDNRASLVSEYEVIHFRDDWGHDSWRVLHRHKGGADYSIVQFLSLEGAEAFILRWRKALAEDIPIGIGPCPGCRTI